jgi:hypothetical protein
MDVLIKRDGNGRFFVGEITPAKQAAPNRPGASQAANQPAMTPARNLADALNIAGGLFGGEQASADASMRRGYKRTAAIGFTDASQEPNAGLDKKS